MISSLQPYLNKKAFQHVATGVGASPVPYATPASIPYATPASIPYATPAPMRGWKANVPRAAAGVGLAANTMGLVQSLSNKGITEEGQPYSDPSYIGAGLNAAGIAHNVSQLRNPSSLASTASKAVGKGVLGTVGRGVLPALGALGVASRLTGPDKDYLGAGIDAVGTAAPYVGAALGGPLGAGIGTAVNWGAQGINAYRDYSKNKQQTNLPSPTTWGALGHNTPAINAPQPTPATVQPQPGAAKLAALNMSHTNTPSRELKAFASGFIKAAMQKNVSITDFQYLVKQAISKGEQLTYDDVAAIKRQLADTGAPTDIYSDPTGEAMRNYKARLLAARDEASGDIPEVAASGAGLRAGALGSALGGLSGAALGAVGKHSGILNMPYKFRQHMPTAGAIGGAALGGLVSALPAAKQKYDTVKALQKMHNTDNLEALQRLGANENAILNQ